MMKLLAGAATAFLCFTGSVSAEALVHYPDRPIMMMVSYGAGGATDYQARIVTMTAGNDDALGMPIAILNMPGAGGRIGWDWFSNHADADGYTLAAYNIPHFIAQSIEGNVEYSADSFEPIANWGADPAVLVVAADSEFETLQDVIDYAKARPGKLTTSGAGLFVGHHIAALQMEKAGNMKIDYVPSDGGGAAAMKAVITGDVMAGINNLSDAYRALEAGHIRVLAVADLERSAFLPDVPTMQEAGLDVDDASVNFRGIMAPKGTPEPIIKLLSEKMPVLFANELVTNKMKAGGSPLRIMRRDEVKAMWAAREETLKELLAGL
ncbi:MAG: tripartite tricarboxylate transporter substrate binding protein [Sulfitobacter sp.]